MGGASMNTPETLLKEARALFHRLILHPSRDHARLYRLIVKAERRKERRQGQLLVWYARTR